MYPPPRSYEFEVSCCAGHTSWWCVLGVASLSLSTHHSSAHTPSGRWSTPDNLACVSTMRPHGALTTALGPLPAGISTAVPAGCRTQPCAWLSFSGGVGYRVAAAGELRDQTELSMMAVGQARSPWVAAATSTRSPAATPACAVGRRRQRPAALPRCASLAFEVDGDRVLPQDARDALAQGDVYKALLLLEEQPVGRTAAAAAGTPTDQEDGDGIELGGGGGGDGGAVYPSSPSIPPTIAVESSAVEASAAAPATAPATSPRAAHARLIQLLWRAGHEKEAVEAFDLARARAREAATVSQRQKQQQQQQPPLPPSSLRASVDQPPPQPAAVVWNGGTTPVRRQEQQQRPPPPPPPRPQERLSAGTKYGAGIPGLFLDLDPGTCHGIMRRKMAAQDYLGVIEAMRAASRVPRRPAGAGARLGGAGGGATEDGGGNEAGVGVGMGWAPTEETYGLALEACGKVRARTRGITTSHSLLSEHVVLRSHAA